MITSFKEYLLMREMDDELVTEGAYDKLYGWLGVGSFGASLVNLILGILQKNPWMIVGGAAGAVNGLRMAHRLTRANEPKPTTRRKSRPINLGRQTWPNESQEVVGSDPTEVIANNPDVQREAAKLGLSHEQLVSIIEKIRSFVRRFGFG